MHGSKEGALGSRDGSEVRSISNFNFLIFTRNFIIILLSRTISVFPVSVSTANFKPDRGFVFPIMALSFALNVSLSDWYLAGPRINFFPRIL